MSLKTSKKRWREEVIEIDALKKQRHEKVRQYLLRTPLYFGQSYGIISKQEGDIIHNLNTKIPINFNDLDRIDVLTDNLKKIAKVEVPKNLESVDLYTHFRSCIVTIIINTIINKKFIDKNQISYVTEGSIPLFINIDRWQEGGGYSHRHVFLKILQEKNRTFKKCLEWCSGVGTIGYDLYSHKIVENLSLLDKNPHVLHRAKKIAIKNKIIDNVNFYVGDSILTLPKTEKFDLIVANPPFFFYENDMPENDIPVFKSKKIENWIYENVKRLGLDEGHESHTNFFSNVREFLRDDGLIIISGNLSGSSPNDFKLMTEKNNLKINNTLVIPDTNLYFMEIIHLPIAY